MNIFFIYPSVNLERVVNYGLACLFGVIAEREHTCLGHAATCDVSRYARADNSECCAGLRYAGSGTSLKTEFF